MNPFLYLLPRQTSLAPPPRGPLLYNNHHDNTLFRVGSGSVAGPSIETFFFDVVYILDQEREGDFSMARAELSPYIDPALDFKSWYVS